FDSGYSLNQKDFFRNFTSIVLFATVGTVISAVTIGLSLFALAEHGYIASLNAESPKEALLFGALLSATDPVATLAVLGQLRVEPQIHSIIFGESVLNDAVAIVLFQTINTLPATTRFHISGADAVEAMANFVGVAVGSVMLGTAIGLLTAFVTKRLLLQASVPTEVNVMMCMAYLAFISADEFGLSGLMAVFFSGCVMSHYAKYNLSPHGQQATHHLASTVANLAEQLTFMYFGFMILPMISPSCSEAEHLQQVFQVHWGFVGYTILLCLGSRALQILPLTLLINFLEGRGAGAREERRDTRISMRSACFIWFSGLRGAIAFALSLSLASENRRHLIPCVVMVVLFTNIVLGQCTVPMLQLLNIRRGVVGTGIESDDEDGMVPSPERAGGSGRGRELVSLSARERSRVRL
ncbi:MAG: sodium/hydrogen exchanger 3, partial [Promethearchaeia archaeon]